MLYSQVERMIYSLMGRGVILTDGVRWYAMKLFKPFILLSFFGDATEQVYGSRIGFHIGPSSVSCNNHNTAVSNKY